MQAMHLVRADGAVFAGASAVREALANVSWGWLARGLANSWLDVCRRSRVLLGGSPPPANWVWWGPLHGHHGPTSGEGLNLEMVKP